MGSAIAAHFANAGCKVNLLDIVDKNNKNKNHIANQAIQKLLKIKPSPLTLNSNIKLLQPGNLEENLNLINDTDWVIEAIVEDLEIKKHFNVSHNCFFPKPKVTSTVLSFKPITNNKFNLKNPKTLETVTRILFSNRRKMINKNFKKLFKQNKLVSKKLNISLNQRPEELSSEMFYKIALQYEKLTD